MNKVGPIVIIDDDQDDLDMYDSIFKELETPNEIKKFRSSEKALAHIREMNIKPFLILSDVNMPVISGFEIRKIINDDPDLNIKCIPFIFFSTDASPEAVKEAYILSVQGIFQKPNNYVVWREMVKNILAYWTDCMSPSFMISTS